MLTQISVRNYAIADALDVELYAGMTALTGETGAGKSIMLDALGLALGDRSDSGVVGPKADKAEVHAHFDISQLPRAQQWLKDRELLDGNECLLRRVLTKEGRSRAFINGQAATLSDVKSLGGLLVDIHSQHAHQSLLKTSEQRRLLDAWSEATDIATELKQVSQRYLSAKRTLEELSEQRDEHSAQSQLLRYQLEELDALAPDEQELQQLEQEHKHLANLDAILANSQFALDLCSEREPNIGDLLQQAIHALSDTAEHHAGQRAALEMLESARIQVEEAGLELKSHEDIDRDPQRLAEVEARLDALHSVARKHHVQARDLPQLQQDLSEQLQQLAAPQERLEALQVELEELANKYQKLAQQLSKRRSKGAKKLQTQVEALLKELAMGGCRFVVELAPQDNDMHPTGQEQVNFLIASNPGSEPGPLNRIASGGELSRISLAIQVITAQVAAVPTVVFDEVDVGIGGATAEIVGQLLHQLSVNTQVLCVTHQAQVASQADQHLQVSKVVDAKQASTHITALDEDRRIEEVARMLGGVAITDNTLAHAREMVHQRPH